MLPVSRRNKAFSTQQRRDPGLSGFRTLAASVFPGGSEVSVADLRPLLIGSLFKLVSSLVLACLLAFVVVHSANIWRKLLASVSALCIYFLQRSLDKGWRERSQTTITVPSEPSLSPLFQRPPPLPFL